jgi:hypothetical protein
MERSIVKLLLDLVALLIFIIVPKSVSIVKRQPLIFCLIQVWAGREQFHGYEEETDENLGRLVQHPFRDHGHDTVTVADERLSATTDRALIRACRREGRGDDSQRFPGP